MIGKLRLPWRLLKAGGLGIAALFLLPSAALAGANTKAPVGGADRQVEQYVSVPMPPGFHVEPTELDGPVFSDVHGHTLYVWPYKRMRVGYSGEQKGKPACYNKPLSVTAGLMSPYPPGILLPDASKRVSCTDLWPPVLASADDKPVGKWTILERKDGTHQWAYDEQPLYTSILDHQAGDSFGGSRKSRGDSPAGREVIGPPPLVPPGFSVKTTNLGRLLTSDKSYSVYSYDKDEAGRSMCGGSCTETWNPVLAPQSAQAVGEWTILERAPGVRQWEFRSKPLYTYVHDIRTQSQEGSDVSGWHNVYTQRGPLPPPVFTHQDTIAGEVLADSHGMTVYVYNCGDDSQDQLSCDHPDTPNAYRLAICGGGDQELCAKNWRYVVAAGDVKGTSRTWNVISIDPKTGHKGEPGQPDALRVWAYRDRPIYTYAGDHAPGDVNGDAIGEWRGQRNGLKAIWLRDDFFNEE